MKISTGRFGVAAGFGAAVIFAAGVIRLFVLRFESGDIYPAYSSLRRDPVGTAALYDSLASFRDLAVSRNCLPIEQLAPGPDTTILYLGDTPTLSNWVSSASIASVNRFVRSGGRLVVTMLPRESRERTHSPGRTQAGESGDSPSTEGDRMSETSDDDEDTPVSRRSPRGKRSTSLRANQWMNIDLGIRPAEEDAAATLTADYRSSGLPESVSCHTDVYFAEYKPDENTNATASAGDILPARSPFIPWQTVYEVEGRPVVIEGRIGRGSVVLSAISYFVSNEALRSERHPGLLVWLVGGRRIVVFDEYHHMLMKPRGVATLVREYGLHWSALLILLLAMLFIWQNSVPLVPDSSSQVRLLPPAAGKGSAEGLANLLKRNISGGSVLDVCFDEWLKTPAGRGLSRDAAVAAMRARIIRLKDTSSRRRNIAAAYNDLSGIVEQMTSCGMAGGEDNTR